MTNTKARQRGAAIGAALALGALIGAGIDALPAQANTIAGTCTQNVTQTYRVHLPCAPTHTNKAVGKAAVTVSTGCALGALGGGGPVGCVLGGAGGALSNIPWDQLPN